MSAAEQLDLTPTVTVTRVGRELVVRTPFNGHANQAWRTIPGRRWDASMRANVVPVEQRVKVWELLLEFYEGAVADGPEGLFFVVRRRP